MFRIFPPLSSRHLPAAAAILAGAAFFLPALAPAQTGSSGDLLEEQRVTAVDTLLHFDRDGLSTWMTGNATPENLKNTDFEVLVGGQPRPVVEVEAFEHKGPADRSPWNQLIYIDCNMLSTGNLRSALGLLHRELDLILEIGPLEVILADPAPRVLAASTRDFDRLDDLLSRLALDTECRDLPQELRDELLRVREAKNPQPAEGAHSGDQPAEPAPTPAELAAAAREGEIEAVRVSTLALLETLAQDPRAGGAQKVVYLLHNGFDRRAEAFYLKAGAPAEEASEKGPEIGPILLAKLISAYGWTVMPVSQPAFEASLRGAEVGKFLVQLESGNELMETDPKLTIRPDGTPLDDKIRHQTLLAGLTASLREQRDPKRAESYLELGQALVGSKKWPEAENAFRQAIYHFDNHKKYRDRQAKAWLGVGMAKAAQGDLVTGRAATERAIEIDPKLVERGEASSVGLGDRALFLAGLAEATLGRAVVGEQQLRQGFQEFAIRLRLTYQVAGDPDGRLMPLEIRHKGGQKIKALPWARFGTPEEIATVRLLASLDDDLGMVEPEGGLDLTAFAATRGKLLDLGELAGEGEAKMRVSILRGNPEGAQRIEHRTYKLKPQAERDLPASRLDLSSAGYLAVLVENLETGDWGIRSSDSE
jgi:tetratricopeptide (TPR) repeat protein